MHESQPVPGRRRRCRYLLRHFSPAISPRKILASSPLSSLPPPTTPRQWHEAQDPEAPAPPQGPLHAHPRPPHPPLARLPLSERSCHFRNVLLLTLPRRAGVPATQSAQPSMMGSMMANAGSMAIGSVVGHGISNMLFGGSSGGGEQAVQQQQPQQQSAFADSQNGPACSMEAKG